MAELTALEAQLARLNDEQREAAETIDGPLLVIAGPGTGKTQLLSVRAANILAERDVSPGNILCLTYTEAGSEAMRKRLVELVGREGYGIEVYTFHSFANRVRDLYPQYFDRPATALLATDLQRKQLVKELLSRLTPENPLFNGRQRGVQANLGAVMGAIDNLKRMGVAPDELRAIARQNEASVAYLMGTELVPDYLAAAIPRKGAEKEAFVADFAACVDRVVSLAPSDLTARIVATPGIYQPFLLWLRTFVDGTELIDEGGRTEGFQAVRKALGAKDRRTRAYEFKAARQVAQSLELADLYERYLREMDERDLYDFQDMINDAVEAVASHSELADELRERYRYLQVDEFQDTNGSQMRLVRLICPEDGEANVMVVGDDDQAIMRFQGASVEGIHQFREAYRPASVVLKVNYRSTPALVGLGQTVANQIGNRLVAGADKAITAFQAESGQTVFATSVYQAPEIEYDAVARDIRARLDAGFLASAEKPEEAIAVIAPKRRCLEALIPFLHHYDVPFTYDIQRNVASMESMQTFLALCRCVSALARGDVPRAEAELPQVVSSRELGLDHGECVRFAIEARTSGKGWFAALGESGNPVLRKLHGDLVDWASRAQSDPVRALLFDLARPLTAFYRGRAAEEPLAMAEFQGGISAFIAAAQAELDARARSARPADPHPVRLPALMDMFTSMTEFDVEVEANIPLGRPDAVTLTTAHSSKGLEYDLVYVLDADDDTWHKGRNQGGILPVNLLTGTERDDDDMTRLLFVALTRAKRLLRLSSAKDVIVRELQGVVEVEPVEVDPAELGQIVETAWVDRFKLDTPELVGLLEGTIAPRALSASSLNAFVTYQPGCENSVAYPLGRLLPLPEAPSEAADFGTAVHAFLKDYVDQVLLQGRPLEPLYQRHLALVRALDHPEDVVRNLASRFERVAKVFVPTLADRLVGTVRTETKVSSHTPGDVPLFGICDVLAIDDAARTVRVLDYKTGQPKDRPDRNYLRQLQFYKLLIENSPDFAGYRVVETADLYVEPRNRTEDELGEPLTYVPSEEDAEHLERLVEVVWRRIREGRFDTSAFEESEAYLELMEKRPRSWRDPLQQLYEDWLIATG